MKNSPIHTTITNITHTQNTQQTIFSFTSKQINNQLTVLSCITQKHAWIEMICDIFMEFLKFYAQIKIFK